MSVTLCFRRCWLRTARTTARRTPCTTRTLTRRARPGCSSVRWSRTRTPTSTLWRCPCSGTSPARRVTRSLRTARRIVGSCLFWFPSDSQTLSSIQLFQTFYKVAASVELSGIITRSLDTSRDVKYSVKRWEIILLNFNIFSRQNCTNVVVAASYTLCKEGSRMLQFTTTLHHWW